MPLTLIKETGTGLADANSYASAADGDTYHLGHLYATAWTTATLATKEAALVFATRLVDALFQFRGARATSAQALQWPRFGCTDPDAVPDYAGLRLVSAVSVPSGVRDAVIETARALIIEDRTANPMGEGLRFANLAGMQQTFDSTDRRPVIPRVAQAMLRKFGTMESDKGGMVQLTRV